MPAKRKLDESKMVRMNGARKSYYQDKWVELERDEAQLKHTRDRATAKLKEVGEYREHLLKEYEDESAHALED